jgi:hypothetical protein
MHRSRLSSSLSLFNGAVCGISVLKNTYRRWLYTDSRKDMICLLREKHGHHAILFFIIHIKISLSDVSSSNSVVKRSLKFFVLVSPVRNTVDTIPRVLPLMVMRQAPSSSLKKLAKSPDCARRLLLPTSM